MALRKFFSNGQTISLIKKQSWQEVSPYFTKEEIFSPDTIKIMSPLNLDALKRLNAMREFLGTSILVNHGPNKLRGVRSIREQLSLVETNNASQLSMHVAGMAFDISSPKADLQVLLELAIAFSFSTVIAYDTFIHIDTRNRYRNGGENPGSVIRPLVVDYRKNTKGAYEITPYVRMAEGTSGKSYSLGGAGLDKKTGSKRTSGEASPNTRQGISHGTVGASVGRSGGETPESDSGGDSCPRDDEGTC